MRECRYRETKRVVRSLANVMAATQQMKQNTSNALFHFKPRGVCQLVSIEITSGPYKETGNSGNSSTTITNMSEIVSSEGRNFREHFEAEIQKKNVKYRGGNSLRTQFVCAEPNALSKLLLNMQNSGHAITQDDFIEMKFTEGAKDTSKPASQPDNPCEVCQQWVENTNKNMKVRDWSRSFNFKIPSIHSIRIKSSPQKTGKIEGDIPPGTKFWGK